MARYEEERYGGQRDSARRGGYSGRGRDDDDFEQQERDRYRSSEYGREYGERERSRGANEGSWRAREQDSGRSLGGREYEPYDEENYGSPYRAGGGEGNRYAGQYGQGSRNQGGQRYGQSMRDFNPSQGFGWSPQSGQGSQGYGQRYGGSQAFQGPQGYGSYENYGPQSYGPTSPGDMSSQRSQADYQSHIGKGPKNWQRSDERIRDEVSEALARHPEIDATEIEIRVQSGEVTLTGTVTERRAKRMAEDVAEDVFGVKDVTNQIKVDKSSGQVKTGDRDVTSAAEREGRTSTGGLESPSRRTAAGTTAGATTR